MELRVLWVVVLMQVLITAAFFLILPRIARRGLLFGVYVGEERWGGDEARRITRGWYTGMGVALAVSLAIGFWLVSAFSRSPAGALASIFALLFLQALLYLRAYFQARALAVPGVPQQAAAALVPDLPHNLVFPAAAVLGGLVAGLVAIGYAWLYYPHMPQRVPTHFGVSGAPDQWAPRSFLTVMLLPIGTLFMGVSLGVVAWMIAHAKRAIRIRDGGVSVEAQIRFRPAMSRFMSGVAILTSLMMLLLSIASVRVSVGLADRLPMASMGLAIVLVVFAIGGSLYLAFRYGQGGARLERSAGGAPLTNGLADNTRWVLGVFYVNREDPSFFVEKRFGLGYTINFGNTRAVALVVTFFVVMIAFAAIAVLSSGS
jgi:uncharacterized membrane protein